LPLALEASSLLVQAQPSLKRIKTHEKHQDCYLLLRCIQNTTFQKKAQKIVTVLGAFKR
jgi:hypothetical protein